MRNGLYCLVIAPPEYPGRRYRDRYIYRHHLNFWKKTGMSLPPGHEVHHKDGNHKNDDPSNLRLMTVSEHRKLHAKLRAEKRASLTSG